MHSSSTPGRAKGSRLLGGAVTEEALESSASVLERRGARTRAGLQQFFSPPEAAALACRVITGREAHADSAPFVLDPTAGNGALIAAWPRVRRSGVEIDPDQVEAGDYTALRGDLQRLYPLMRLAGARFPAVVCNPPFGLDWQDPASGRTMNSTALCLRFALGLLEERGQGLLIAGRDRYHREIEPLPEAAGVWCTIDCDDLFDGTALPVTLAFFVQPANRREAETLRLGAERMGLAGLAPQVIQWRREACGQVTRVSYDDGSELREAFACVQREHDRRRSERRTERRHDVELRGGRLRCHPSAFAKLALAERGLLRQVQGLNGKALLIWSSRVSSPHAKPWRALTTCPEHRGSSSAVHARLPEARRRSEPGVDDVHASVVTRQRAWRQTMMLCCWGRRSRPRAEPVRWRPLSSGFDEAGRPCGERPGSVGSAVGGGVRPEHHDLSGGVLE
jgi:hypothetical protein